MSNLTQDISIHTLRIDKNNINEKSLQPLFETDLDFSENEDYFREDTLELGYENEAERVSKEIYDKCYRKDKSEIEIVNKMFKEIFKVRGFIGKSDYYGHYQTEFIETDFEYIFIIAVTI